jgi:hypothetical protein
MWWAIGGVVVGLLLGGFIVFYVFAYNIDKGMSQILGYPTSPWWKFWK